MKEVRLGDRQIIWSLTIIGALFTLGGLALLIFAAILPIINSVSMLSWDEGQAEIVEATYETMELKLESIDIDTKVYTPKLTYRFEHAGKEYTGTEIYDRGVSFETLSGVEYYLESYAPASKHAIYYNADNPSDVLLTDSRFHGSDFLILIVALIVVGLGGFTFAAGFFHHRME